MNEPPTWMVNKVLEIAYSMYGRYRTGKQFHLTFVFDKKKLIAIGWNNYNAMHPANKFGEYIAYKSNSDDYQPSLHSEISALIKLGEENTRKFVFVNIRIGPNGNVNMAKPCQNCQRVFEQVGMKKLYYSTNDGTFTLWK